MSYYVLACKYCSYENDIRETSCANCGSNIPEPGNVKRALLPIEIETLKNEYKTALDELTAKNLLNETKFLVEEVNKGKAIINSSFDFIWKLIVETSVEYQSYRELVAKNLRKKAETQDDINRCLVDSWLFGSDMDIIYAAFTINDQGLQSYGEASVLLKTDLIKNRTSALQTNSFTFFKALLKEGALEFGKPFPPGYISVWNTIYQLAIKKVKNLIETNQTKKDFGYLILQSKRDRSSDEFIELFISGRIISSSIEKVKLPSAIKSYSDSYTKIRLNELSRKIDIEYY